MPDMAKPKDRKRRPVNYRLPEDILEALDRLIESTRRTATEEVLIALEKHLHDAGVWAPPEPEKKKPRA